jgi:hypothetical protein
MNVDLKFEINLKISQMSNNVKIYHPLFNYSLFNNTNINNIFSNYGFKRMTEAIFALTHFVNFVKIKINRMAKNFFGFE